MRQVLATMITLAAAGPLLAQTPADHLWVGPMPFVKDRTLRPDYFPVLSDPAAWPTVLGRAQVLKSYLMVLPDVPVEGKTEPELTDDQLGKLARLCRERGLKVAFEVGGLRQGPNKPGADWGETHAESELAWLRRWARVGGTIDYLTTDHAVMTNIGAHFVNPEMPDCGMAMPQAMEELVDYFVAVRREFPKARLGCIESLGYFHVTGPDGKEYARTVPALPVWPFEAYLDALLTAMQRRGLTLDHFHIDFGYEGVHFDGLAQGKLDFGRVLGVERYAQSRGVKAGVIVNAFHDQAVKEPDPARANQEACDRTGEFLRGYLAAGGQAEHLVLQTWQPFPDRTGPETDPLTVLGLVRELLRDAGLAP